MNPDREEADKGGEDQPQDTLQETAGALKLATLGIETMRRLDKKKGIPSLLQIAEFGIEHMAKLREIEQFLNRIQPALDGRCDWKIIFPPRSNKAAEQAMTHEESIRKRDTEIPMLV